MDPNSPSNTTQTYRVDHFLSMDPNSPYNITQTYKVYQFLSRDSNSPSNTTQTDHIPKAVNKNCKPLTQPKPTRFTTSYPGIRTHHLCRRAWRRTPPSAPWSRWAEFSRRAWFPPCQGGRCGPCQETGRTAPRRKIPGRSRSGVRVMTNRENRELLKVWDRLF